MARINRTNLERVADAISELSLREARQFADELGAGLEQASSTGTLPFSAPRFVQAVFSWSQVKASEFEARRDAADAESEQTA